MATPQVLSRKSNGVAPAASNDTGKSKSKVPPEGDKVIVRRLPPGMMEDEFLGILGDQWKVGNGKVDWMKYFPGKFTTDPSKVSRASRAYIHVKKRDELMALQQAVEAVANAVRDQPKDAWSAGALVAPPVVELAIYKKVPGGKKRSDARQGTIDQDPEFMAFLESLANPDAMKDPDAETATEEGKGEKVTTTPLVEYLKEKKANKAKEAAAAKNAKHSRQESKGKASASGTNESKKKPKGEKSDKPKETVKILTKKAAAEAAADAAKAAANQIKAAQASSASKELPKSRRAGIAAAARILQRDLGLSPGNAHRKARLEVAKAEAEAKAASAKEAAPATGAETTSSTKTDEEASSTTGTKTQAAASALSGRSRNRRRGGGEEAKGKADKATDGPSSAPSPAKPPVILMKKKSEGAAATEPPSSSSGAPAANPPTPTTASAPSTTPTGPKTGASKPNAANKKNSTPAVPTPGATRAFVKHVSSSLGVTEATLREALQAFGPVVSIEVDRRKGFAYTEFQSPDGLAKAMAASPVTVGQTTVQVLERKETATKKEKAPAPSAPPAVSKGAAQAEGSSAAPPAAPTGPASEGKGGGERRGGRRRGGRGRGGDKDGGAKEVAGGKGTEGGAATASAAPTASAAG